MKNLILALALVAAPAHAQQMKCGPYAEITGMLSQSYGEQVRERGLDDRGTLLEWWGNSETGTWSLVAVGPNGVACIPAYGGAFETLEPVALGTDI